MGVSLDGYIVGPDGDFDWTAPDQEVFRFVYETMLFWETADQDPSLDDAMLESGCALEAAAQGRVLDHAVSVQGNARLASDGLAKEIEQLRAEPGEGAMAIGGATLAAEAAALGLIEEYRARVYPVLVGGGIPSSRSASAGGSRTRRDLWRPAAATPTTHLHRPTTGSP